ncbi:hypothetical protein LTR15_011809 [Elasticomyces elasticus]|nr:hypothetical protein LTR15_011809 [Elasticomyces elasticus]
MKTLALAALFLTLASAKNATSEPCARVSTQLASSDESSVDASLALECLRTVPLDAAGDALQVEGIMGILANFQSTLPYLKDPPPGYLYPSIDIVAGLAEISAHLAEGKYNREYDIQNDIYKLIKSAFDGHTYYIPDINAIFAWTRGIALYSISSDGLALPQIYADSDLPSLSATNKTDYTPSPIVSINGRDVETVLNEIATTEGMAQDPDANYNGLFPQIPMNYISTGASSGIFAQGRLYQESHTSVTFGNGTTKNLTNRAASALDFTDIVDGPSFFETFCTGPPTTSDSSANTTSPSNTTSSAVPTFTQVGFTAVPTQTVSPSIQNFPDPWSIASDASISGYFPDEHSDLAVLMIPTFEPANPVEYQDLVRQFLATALAMKKTKLAIDLRTNGGGDVFLGYDLFKQLFPKADPYGATNFIASPLIDTAGEIVTTFYSNVTTVTINNYTGPDYGTPLNVRMDLTAHLQQYDSWSDFFGPHERNGGNFTSLTRYNLSDAAETSPFLVSGYQNLSNNPTQVFQSENIVLIQDGGCGSTCTIFSEMMKQQAHVKQIAFGGRKQYGPMQGVGSVKGANIFSFDTIQDFVGEALGTDATPEQQITLQAQWGGLLNGSTQAVLRAALVSGSPQANVNARNNIRDGDDSETPLQFVYEASDCRLFYTAQQILEQKYVWDATYNAMWGNGTCVHGSTGHRSSQPGTGYILSAPDNTDAGNFFGSNSSIGNPSHLGCAYDNPTACAAASVAGGTSLPTPTASALEQIGGGSRPTGFAIGALAGAALVGLLCEL